MGTGGVMLGGLGGVEGVPVIGAEAPLLEHAAKLSNGANQKMPLLRLPESSERGKGALADERGGRTGR